MTKKLNMKKIFSTLKVTPETQRKLVFNKLTTIPQVNSEFIFTRLDTLNQFLKERNPLYRLVLSLEKEYVKVIIIKSALPDSDWIHLTIDVEFKFYLHALEAEFVIVVDRDKNEYSDVFKMEFLNMERQFCNIMDNLRDYSISKIVQNMQMRYRESTQTHSLINQSAWVQSVKNHFAMSPEERKQYDPDILWMYSNDITKHMDQKDHCLIHNSLLTLNPDGSYKHFYLILENLSYYITFHQPQSVKDINGNSQPDYIIYRIDKAYYC